MITEKTMDAVQEADQRLQSDSLRQVRKPDLSEQRTDEMRDEIDCTRSDLANKLGALEDRVMGNVQSAQETVEDSIQIAKETVATVKRTFDLKHHVEQHPWAMVGGCMVAGLALGVLFQNVGRRKEEGGTRRDERSRSDSPVAAQPTSFAQAAPAPPYQAPPPSSPGLFDLLHDEIEQVKGMAIGYVMGLARDAIKEAVPQMAPKIDEVMNSIVKKLGGEPAQQSVASGQSSLANKDEDSTGH
jgi:ElaB/YqjD/DUF883 family membrane-anchored ribosome-binding protein